MSKALTIAAGLVVAVIFMLIHDANAQSQRTEHTFSLDDKENRPTATLQDVSWLVGSWVGDAFGSRFEEVWNPPSAGSMVGMFKLINDDEVVFYEILLLVEEEGSLSLKVKHFTKDFIAWETKEEFVSFPFIGADENAIHFFGISFYRKNEHELDGYIVMREGDEVREEPLRYRRVAN